MEQEKSQLHIGIILSYINMLVGNLIPLLYTPVMLQLLGKKEYGLYKLSSTVTSYLTLISLGIGSAVVGWGLALGNYIGGAAVQSASALESIKALYTYIPLAVTLVGIIAILNGNIDKIYPTFEKDLLERRKSKE